MIVRSYHPNDLLEIQRIHEENKLDFGFPNLNSSLFMVNKVFLDGSGVRASYALRMVAECNLWLDKSNWATPKEKWGVIKALDREAMDAARDIGIDGVQCFLPPGYERFGKRICGKDGLGFTEDRPNWRGYGKFLVGAQ